jgi:hypothetical protein
MDFDMPNLLNKTNQPASKHNRIQRRSTSRFTGIVLCSATHDRAKQNKAQPARFDIIDSPYPAESSPIDIPSPRDCGDLLHILKAPSDIPYRPIL